MTPDDGGGKRPATRLNVNTTIMVTSRTRNTTMTTKTIMTKTTMPAPDNWKQS